MNVENGVVVYLCLLYSELLYEDVFSVWETIWAAKHIASSHFVLFIALALVESYRDIILSNSMDFTDIIKFFNGLYHILNLLQFFLLMHSAQLSELYT
jgi:hypothetical protein